MLQRSRKRIPFGISPAQIKLKMESNNALPPLKNMVVPCSSEHLDLPALHGFEQEIIKVRSIIFDAKTAKTGDEYTTTLLDPSSREFQHIMELAGSDSPVAYSSIERVVNPTLLRRFDNARKERIMRKSGDVVLLNGMTRIAIILALGCSSEQIDARLTSNLINGLNNDTIPEYADNLALLFHCTKRANVDDILSQGLDSRLGAGGLLGQGIYFADVWSPT
jgi:hypothetical protein